MRKISFSAAFAVLILIGVGVWTVSTTHTLAATAGIDPSGMMANAKDLPTSHYDDYSVIFN
jgi:hypothetical protein